MYDPDNETGSSLIGMSVRPTEEYRLYCKQQIASIGHIRGTSKATLLVDLINQASNRALTDTIVDQDVWIETVREYLDTQYPPAKNSQHHGWLPIRLAGRTSKRPLHHL